MKKNDQSGAHSYFQCSAVYPHGTSGGGTHTHHKAKVLHCNKKKNLTESAEAYQHNVKKTPVYYIYGS